MINPVHGTLRAPWTGFLAIYNGMAFSYFVGYLPNIFSFQTSSGSASYDSM